MQVANEDLRQPVVAGRFYPGVAESLARQVHDFLVAGPSTTREVCAAMAPHAGYVYSGQVAGQVFAGIEIPPRVVIMCPNHTGIGPAVSIMDRGAYRIPGADVPIDGELAAALLAEFPHAEADRTAHRAEHAIEVELPFLVAKRPDVRIVPVVLGNLPLDQAVALGHALRQAVVKTGADVLVLASSDMNHYLPDEQTRIVDRVALAPLLDFDAPALYRTVVDRNISMCGFIPATAMLTYAREAGAATPELIAYATSGDAFGDRSRVVGYAGVVLPR